MKTPSKKRAIVLAAGKGTRMKSDLPKVLFPVCGKPMIEYVLDALLSLNIDEIYVVIGYQGEKVKSALQHYSTLHFVEQTEQLGTGHAVMVCRAALENQEGPVFVIAGDSPMIQRETVERLFLEDEKQKAMNAPASCVLGTIHKEDPKGMGRILRDEQENFLDIVEDKDATDEQRKIKEINMSYYIFDLADLFQALNGLRTNNAQKEYYLTDVPKLLKQSNKKVLALPVLKPVECLGVNTIDDLALVEKEMRR